MNKICERLVDDDSAGAWVARVGKNPPRPDGHPSQEGIAHATLAE